MERIAVPDISVMLQRDFFSVYFGEMRLPDD